MLLKVSSTCFSLSVHTCTKVTVFFCWRTNMNLHGLTFLYVETSSHEMSAGTHRSPSNNHCILKVQFFIFFLSYFWWLFRVDCLYFSMLLKLNVPVVNFKLTDSELAIDIVSSYFISVNVPYIFISFDVCFKNINFFERNYETFKLHMQPLFSLIFWGTS